MNRFLAICGVVFITTIFLHFGMFLTETFFADILTSPEGRGMWVGLMAGLLVGWLVNLED